MYSWYAYVYIYVPLQATLSELMDLASANITVAISDGAGAACEDSTTVNTTIAINLDYGNYPLKVLVFCLFHHVHVYIYVCVYRGVPQLISLFRIPVLQQYTFIIKKVIFVLPSDRSICARIKGGDGRVPGRRTNQYQTSSICVLLYSRTGFFFFYLMTAKRRITCYDTYDSSYVHEAVMNQTPNLQKQITGCRQPVRRRSAAAAAGGGGWRADDDSHDQRWGQGAGVLRGSGVVRLRHGPGAKRLAPPTCVMIIFLLACSPVVLFPSPLFSSPRRH